MIIAKLDDEKVGKIHADIETVIINAGKCNQSTEVAYGGESKFSTALGSYIPDSEAEKKLVRKIDLILLPSLWLIYILSFIDRVNIVSTFFWISEHCRRLISKLGKRKCSRSE